MPISWYPGHMHKARKEIAKALMQTDMVLELLDARAPLSSANPLLRSMAEHLPTLTILTKADLADPESTRVWQEFINARPNSLCLISSADKIPDPPALFRALQQLTDRQHSNKTSRARQILVIGIPNVGKSTLINHLAKRKVAKTGNEPAVTKGLQKVKLNDNWYLVDSPGMMWPKLENQVGAFNLACLGSIRNTAIDIEEIAWHLIERLSADNYSLLQRRYQLPWACPQTTELLLTAIAQKHGCLGKNASINWHRVAELVLDDFRSGRIGLITLEQPGDFDTDSKNASQGSNFQ